MTLSKAVKEQRAATRAKNAAKKSPNDPLHGIDHIVKDAIASGAAARSDIASPAIRSAREIPDTGTVTVACKLPNGLLLRLFKETTEYENVMGGGTREIKIMRPVGEIVRIQGYAVPANKRPRYLITNGNFALTENVDAKFFKTWWTQNESLPCITAGLIFCMARKDEAEAKADSRETMKNGLEPMDQGKDSRSGRTTNPHLADIAPADRK